MVKFGLFYGVYHSYWKTYKFLQTDIFSLQAKFVMVKITF